VILVKFPELDETLNKLTLLKPGSYVIHSIQGPYPVQSHKVAVKASDKAGSLCIPRRVEHQAVEQLAVVIRLEVNFSLETLENYLAHFASLINRRQLCGKKEQRFGSNPRDKQSQKLKKQYCPGEIRAVQRPISLAGSIGIGSQGASFA
jgi:hypothetical protein